jgi:hypothetical protein
MCGTNGVNSGRDAERHRVGLNTLLQHASAFSQPYFVLFSGIRTLGGHIGNVSHRDLSTRGMSL